MKRILQKDVNLTYLKNGNSAVLLKKLHAQVFRVSTFSFCNVYPQNYRVLNGSNHPMNMNRLEHSKLFNAQMRLFSSQAHLDFTSSTSSGNPHLSKPVPQHRKIRGRYNHFHTTTFDYINRASWFHYTIITSALFLCFFGVHELAINWLNKSFSVKFARFYNGLLGRESIDEIEESENFEEPAEKPVKPAKALVIQAKAASLNEATPFENNHDKNAPVAPKRRAGFRDRKVIAYEDRIRAYSTPDKIFRYFATLKAVSADGTTSEVFMTPDDFVRSITPGEKQPDGLGLDSFIKIDLKHYDASGKSSLNLPDYSIFYVLGEKGLITFTDYVFLLTVISIPQNQFEIAFKMFDLNGDGELDADEFDVVKGVILGTTAMGKRHRDHSNTGNTLKPTGSNNSSLAHYFFGENNDKKLTIEKFIEFQSKVQHDLAYMEFQRNEPDEEGKIGEYEFAHSIVAYAGFSEAKKRKLLKKIKQKFKDRNSQGITFEEYLVFGQFLRQIVNVDTALNFYNLAGAAIDQDTLKQVSNSVTGLTLSDHLVDVIFTLFDEDNDGNLSNKEFVAVMKQRLLRGLDKPMDTGFMRLLGAIFTCTESLFIEPMFTKQNK